jgi:hypothetical protein
VAWLVRADDERLEALLESMERRHPDVLSSGGLENLRPRCDRAQPPAPQNPLSVVKAELRHVQSGIVGLEKRLKGLHAVRYS